MNSSITKKLDEIQNNLSKGINDLDVAIELIKMESIESIFEMIQDEVKNNDSLVIAYYALIEKEKNKEEAIQLLEDKKKIIVDFYNFQIEIYELHLNILNLGND